MERGSLSLQLGTGRSTGELKYPMIFEGGFSGHANIPRVEVDEVVRFEEKPCEPNVPELRDEVLSRWENSHYHRRR